MTTNRTLVIAVGVLVWGAMSNTALAGTRESFDHNWRFARFGSQADGSRRPEPGAPNNRLFALSASSEEADKGNFANFAMDGDPASRWCASGPGAAQWVCIDLGKVRGLGSVSVNWESTASYQFVIEGSSDGKAWAVLADKTRNAGSVQRQKIAVKGSARFVRIRTTGLPSGRYASIREIAITDASGAAITNKPAKPAPRRASPADVSFDDSAWRKLNVPHDWAIEGPFRYDIDGNTGKLPYRGIGWYRKHFAVPASDAGKRVFVDFDGAMSHARVFVNGKLAGQWPYGYSSFRVEVTRFLRFGKANVLAVRLDNETLGSRWYPGAGIYRHVRLVKTDPVHVAHWGVAITTPEVSDARASVNAAIKVDNQSAAPVKATVRTDIYELNANDVPGRKVASSPISALGIARGGSATFQQKASVTKPKRWGLAAPNRYLARTIVSTRGKAVDTYETVFGIRSIDFTARNGFLLNGRRVQIQGTCNHHDLGALGAAVNTRAMQRQLEILRAMGCNALRTSHNPPAPEWLDLADKMGFLVMDEAFDCWESGKSSGDYASLYPAWHVKDLQALVRRDVNHPSVIIWSTGNEVAEQGSLNPAKHLRDIVHAADPTRPVSAGVWDGAARSDFRFGVDIFGQNYGIGQYGNLLNYPGNETKPFFSSESSSCISSRGEYFFGRQESDFQISSYDLDHPGWGCTPDAEFEALDRNPAYMGEFVWTGFDYLGEPTPYNSDMTNLLNIHDKDPAMIARMKEELEKLGRIRVPSRSSYFGIVDLAGFPKDRYYLYQARWRPDHAMAHILPHWNWPERVGEVTPVFVYTSGDEAELFLNGKSLGRKTRGPFDYRLRWDDVVYTPGELRVVAYRNGKEWATDVVKTTGEAAKLIATPDRALIKADGADLSYVTVRVADKDGLTVPRSHPEIRFEVAGPGEIVATDNGDATSFVPFQSHKRPAYNGLCLVIVRSVAGVHGPVRLRAMSNGLRMAETTIQTR